MKRHKGDVMVEHEGTVCFYHILITEPSEFGYAEAICAHVSTVSDLTCVQIRATLNVNEPRLGVRTEWLEPAKRPIRELLELHDLPEMRRELRESADCPVAPVIPDYDIVMREKP